MIHQGDCLEVLKTLPDCSVHCCITSPPYFGLRDYGVPGQIGLEPTPEEYVTRMVDVFREVRRVLRDDGTLWLNLGDSYAATTKQTGRKDDDRPHGGEPRGTYNIDRGGKKARVEVSCGNAKPKDLIGIPWRVAFALQADGYYLRQDIIWAKTNPMPESVTDRCTKAHEYLFLLSKSARYYFDAEAIKEPSVGESPICRMRKHDGLKQAKLQSLESSTLGTPADGTRNKRSVWTVSTRPYKGAHFATFPPKLIEPCVLAGCPAAGRRCDCDEVIATPTGSGQIEDPSLCTGRAGMNRPRRDDEGVRLITRREQRHEAMQMRNSQHRREIESECGEAFAHYIRTDGSGARPLPERLRSKFMALGWITPAPPCNHPIEPSGVVLDPFFGSGTTGAVAVQNGRRYVGIELNPAYIELAKARIAEASGPLFSEV